MDATEATSQPTEISADMATTKASLQPTNVSEHEVLELPQWQQDDFNQRMQQWLEKIREAGDYEEGDPIEDGALPDELKCFMRNPKAALHFDSYVGLLITWQGQSSNGRRDWLYWLTQEEPKIFARLKTLILSMESDFDDGKFRSLTCAMELRDLDRCFYGKNYITKNSRSLIAPNGLFNHRYALEKYLKGSEGSRWWELNINTCRNLGVAFYETRSGLWSLLSRYENQNGSQDAQQAIEVPTSGRAGDEQTGLRRRRPDTQAQDTPVPEAEIPVEVNKDHTPIEAFLLLTKAITAAFRQIPFSDLRDALWKDNRAPVSLSLIFTSISSVLIGVAIIKHNNNNDVHFDDGFFTLLSDALIQLFSLYVLLLPFLRGQEPHLRGVWFCTSIGASVTFSVVSCIVYAFSWHASALLRFGGTLASMIAALLLVQGIDKGDRAKESRNANGDV